MVFVLTSLGGLAAHATTMPDLSYGIAAVFAGVALLASLLAGKVGDRLPAPTVRRVFAYLIVVVAAGVAVAAVFAPAALHGG